MSSYRSKYLQEKEQQEEARRKQVVGVDVLQQLETVATDDEKSEGINVLTLASTETRILCVSTRSGS